MTRKQVSEIVTFIYNRIEDAECSCYDYYAGTCWFHMSDDERIIWLTTWVMENFIEASRDSDTIDH